MIVHNMFTDLNNCTVAEKDSSLNLPLEVLGISQVPTQPDSSLDLPGKKWKLKLMLHIHTIFNIHVHVYRYRESKQNSAGT